jgi:type II secretory pathway component HofQ
MVIAGSQSARAYQDTSLSLDASGALSTPIDVELDKAQLSVALKLIQKRTGLNILVENPTYNYGKVSLSLRARPVGEVLKLIAESAGADLWQKDGIYFIGPKGSGPKPEAVLPKGIDEFPDMSRERPQRRYEKIKLQFADPQTVLKELGVGSGMRQDFLDQFTANVMHQMLDVGKIPFSAGPAPRLDFAPGNGNGNSQPTPVAPSVPTGSYGSGVQGLANQYGNGSASAFPSFSGDSGSDQAAHRVNDQERDEFGRGGQFGGGGGGFGGGAGGGGGFGGGQGGGGGFGGGQGAGRGAGGGGGQGGGFGVGAQLLPQGLNPTDLFAFDGDNSIIVVSSDPAAIAELRRVIAFLDVKPQQIQIKAEFIEVDQNDVSSFGIDWNFQRVNLVAGVSTGFQTSNTAFIQYAAGNIQTQLSFILTTGRGKLVTSPMATTLNNVPVVFNSFTQIPIFLSTPVIAQNGTVALAPQLNIATAATGLAILPRINGDGSISLAGSVFLTDIPSYVTGPDGSSAPILVQQTVPIQRIIRDGDTMVIAGLVRKSDLVSENKVPLLGDLPLIGSLFRAHNVTTADSDLLVFITPSIIPERIPNGAVGGIGAGGGGLGATTGASLGAAPGGGNVAP